MTRKIIAGLLLAICLSVGNYLAQLKPLWNDEIYTQTRSIDCLSYKDILLNNMTEGNSSPLFYFIQKGICDIFGYKFPMVWHGEWYIADFPSQVITRINSNLFMSLSIAAIFYFFAGFYSWQAGVYSFLVSISSFMVWSYWAEARPYALWVFLTTLQMLLFLYATHREPAGSKKFFSKEKSGRVFRWLIIVHLLLSFTIFFSAVQIFMISFLLFFSIRESSGESFRAILQRDWKKYMLLTVIPLSICFFYYTHSPRYKFFFFETPRQLIEANIPLDRIGILVLFGLFFFSSKKAREAVFKSVPCLLFMILIFAATFLMLMILKMRESHEVFKGFSLSSRYFIYLTPMGIIATTLFSVNLLEAFYKKRWMFLNMAIGLTGLLVIRFLRTFMDVYNSGLY